MHPAIPQRCTLVNLATTERFECQLNPSRLQERINAVQYARLEPIGSGHQVMHYRNTENRRLSLEFYLDAVGTGFSIAAFRAFLLALTLPSSGVRLSAPPRLLLIWPPVLTSTVRLTELTFSYEQLAADGTPLVATAQCLLEVDATTEMGGGMP